LGADPHAKVLAKKMAEIPKAVSEQLKSFEATKSLGDIEKAFQAADAITPNTAKDENARKRLRSAKLSSWLAILNDVDKAEDATFDPKDVPAATVAPPPSERVVLDSGIDPASVRDPAVRKAYEDAIAANRQKAERYKLQTGLRALDERLLSRIDRYIKAEYKVTGPDPLPEDRREVAEAVGALIERTSRKEQLGKLIAGR
jgi:hypothetical protein